MKTITRFISTLLVISVAAPLIATAQTVTSANASQAAQLTAQIQTLLAQISALQAQTGGASTVSTGASAAGTAASGPCPQLGSVLKLGSSGADVTRLQQFLSRDPSIYPEAQVTGYYGALTQAAVQRWQVKYNIVSSGSADTTGYGQVGPRTAAAMSLQCSSGSSGSTAGGSTGAAPTGPVGGFIQLTPVAGNAPLTANVTATVNTTDSCTGAIYTLDWGDGTVPQQIVVPAGNCTQLVQTLQHVYAYGGNFRVMLSAGAHQTYATITVYGGSAPTVSGGTGIVTPTQNSLGVPNETFNVSAASGPAPLTVTFSGIVNTNDRGYGTGDNTDALDFGDGTMAKVQLPASLGGWLNYSLAHTYNAAGGYRAVLHQGSITSSSVVGNVTITVSQASSGSGSNTYGIVSVSPGAGSAYGVSLNIVLPSCAQYQVDWGDGSSVSTATAACQNGGVSATLQHVYTQPAANTSASYTIKLKDGSGNTQASSGITISG